MNAIKKLLKITFWTLLTLVLVIVALVATLPLWIGPIALPMINKTAPKVVKTRLAMEKLYLNPYQGRLEIGGLELDNPAGYSEPTAASISNLLVDVEMGTLNEPVIHVEEVNIDGLFLSYLSNNGTNNLDAIYWNYCGGKEAAEAKSAASKQQKTELAQKEAARRAALTDEERAIEDAKAEFAELNAKKFCIDHLRVSGVRVKLGFLPIAVPTIELHNIGTHDKGLTLQEVWTEIFNAVMKMIGNTAGTLKSFGVKGIDALSELGAKGMDSVDLDKATDSVKGATDAAADAVKNVKDSFKSLFGN